MKIGVLALQGDFDVHRKRLEELGAEVVLVKKPEQFGEIAGLVIPGGESSTFLNLLGEEGFAKLKDFVHVKPTFGTCAGAILLANEVENPKQAGLGALDITIRRNAYGRPLALAGAASPRAAVAQKANEKNSRRNICGRDQRLDLSPGSR